MIDLYTWPTPNGRKISIALEELELPYRVVLVNIGRGEQFAPEFLAISPNNRIPAIVDHAPEGGGAPISVFESGAILLYLAEKTGRLIPRDLRGRTRVHEWLAWQIGGLGPMAGQANHFAVYADEKIPYAIDRYTREYARLLGVLDRALARSPFVAGDAYSIADIAIWPWIFSYERIGQSLASFPNVRRWSELVAARPAVERGRKVGDEARTSTFDAEARKHLFGR